MVAAALAQIPDPGLEGRVAEGGDREHQQIAVGQDQLQLLAQGVGGGGFDDEIRLFIQGRVRLPEHRHLRGQGLKGIRVGEGVLNEGDVAIALVLYLLQQRFADLTAAENSNFHSSLSPYSIDRAGVCQPQMAVPSR